MLEIVHFTCTEFKTLRIMKGYSQRKLADRIGCCQKTVSNWENGKTTRGLHSHPPEWACTKLNSLPFLKK